MLSHVTKQVTLFWGDTLYVCRYFSYLELHFLQNCDSGMIDKDPI